MPRETVATVSDPRQRARQSGATRFVQLHLELDDVLTLKDTHAIANDVEQAIKAAFPGTDVVIHQDPVSVVPD